MDKNKVAEFFDSVAAYWDRKERPATREAARLLIQKLNIPPAAHVLDVGCGTGILYPWLKEATDNALHIDLSQKMLAQFKKRYPAAQLLQGDFETAKLEPQFYDFIIAFNVFPHFENKTAIFKRAAELLKYGGVFVIAHAQTRAELAATHGKNEETENDVLPTVEEMGALYKAAGFERVKIEEGNPGFFAAGYKYFV